MLRKIFENKIKKGSAIAYGLVITSVVSILILSILQFVVSQVKYGYHVSAKEQAFNVAEAGIYFYRWYLAHETDGKSVKQVQDFWQNDEFLGASGAYSAPYSDPSAGIIGTYEIAVAKPAVNSNVVEIVSTGYTSKYPNIKRTVKVRLRRSTWSDFAVLTNEASSFDTEWEINGKIMSNTGVHFDGVARNVVSSGLSSYYDSDPDVAAVKPGVWTSWTNEFNTAKNSNVFLAGKKFPAVQKDFTGVTVDLNAMKNVAKGEDGNNINNCTASACYFENELMGKHIKLRTDGKFEISTVKDIKNNSNTIKNELAVQTYDIPDGGIIFVNGNVWIEGKLDGKRVTIVAANLPNSGTNANIYVGMANLQYTNTDGSDVVGLISQGDVELSTESPADLLINASIIAQLGSVLKRDYNPNCCGGGCETNKNSINIFGSVASNKPIIFTVAKLCNSEKSIGYTTKKIEYDNNLLMMPPPYFPYDAYYSIDLWEEL